MDTDQVKGKVTEQGVEEKRPEAVPGKIKPAAIDTYLNIDGVKGESTDDNHKDWIEE